MVKIVTTAGAITVLMVATASAQTLTEAQVLEAIALGQSTKKDIALKKVSAGYDFALRGPFARVVRLAADAANRQKSIVPANIPAAVLEPTLEVEATPNRRAVPVATHISLRPRDGSKERAIAAEASARFPFEWYTSRGDHGRADGLRATFSLAALPEGDFDVI